MIDLRPHELQAQYARAAAEYCAALTQDELMEATSQAQQRQITLASLEIVRAQRTDVYVFNELLVQDLSQQPRIQVVPDNMVVLTHKVLRIDTSYDLPIAGVTPFWTLEYASKSNLRKDYDRNVNLYERLQVPYYLIFSPEAEELVLFELVQGRYRSVVPDEQTQRVRIARLDLEMRVVEGWVRYWYRGELVPLPRELAAQVRVQQGMIFEQKSVITEQKAQLTEQKTKLSKRNKLIAQQTDWLTQKESVITEQKTLITQKDAALTQKESVITEQKNQLVQKEEALTQKEEVIVQQTATLADLQRQLAEYARRFGQLPQ